MLDQLPSEILHHILYYLRSSHIDGLSINATALQTDLRALCLSSRQLHEVAQEHLYGEIWLPSHSFGKMTKLRWVHRPSSRLEKLLRSLKKNSSTCALVRCIRVTYDLAKTLEKEFVNRDSKSSRTNDAILVVAEIVRHCWNLERFFPNNLAVNAGLDTSLASCQKLKSHIWQLPFAAMSDGPYSFSSYHDNWNQLHTLAMVHQSPGWNLSPGLVTAVLQKVPALQHLILSKLQPADFHNGTLLMLPPLKSLRLEELHGITDQGLEQFAHSRTAFSLQSLALCGLEITALRTTQELLSGMLNLRRFTLHQNTSPELAQMQMVTSANFSLSSNSLEYLHWDVLTPGYGTAILANSIASGRFPKLRKVKVPCDSDGAIQRLCRPVSYRPLALEDLQVLEDLDDKWHYHRSLEASQIEAQIRIHESRKQPSFNVVVQDEDANVQHEHTIGSYLGNIASHIEYSLDPAVEDTGSALANIDLATHPGPYLTRFHGKWHGCNDSPDGSREFLLGLDMFF